MLSFKAVSGNHTDTINLPLCGSSVNQKFTAGGMVLFI